MKRRFYWRVFFIKYVITVIVSDEVVKACMAGRLKLITDDRCSSRSSLNDTVSDLVLHINKKRH
jgi:hypothetical protein